MPQANFLDLYYQDNMSDKQHAIDFAGLMAQGILGVAHKASQGSHFRDPLYASRRTQAFNAGMPFAAYHFLDASDPVAQAQNFKAACGWDDATLPKPLLIADYEPNGNNTPSLQQLQAFIVWLEANCPGALVWVYSSNLIRETLKPSAGGHQDPDMIGVEDFFQRHPLWLAEFGPRENVPWPWNTKLPGESVAPGAVLWQFNDHGKFAAILGPVDVNYYAGSREQLLAYWPTPAMPPAN
jgi:lysozyme